MNTDLRDRFDRNIRAKAGIGIPFTMEDVAETLGVPSNELRSSWLVQFRDNDTIRNIGTQPSRSKKHQVIIWCGTYYLDLEAEEEAERQALAEHYRDAMEAPHVYSNEDAEKLQALLAS